MRARNELWRKEFSGMGVKEAVRSANASSGHSHPRTLLSIDLSNYARWFLLEDVKDASGERYKYVADETALAQFSDDNELFQERRVFMPRTEFVDVEVDKVTDWLLTEHAQIFNSPDFEVQDDRLSYALKLGRALGDYFNHRERRGINLAVRAKVKTLIRGYQFVNVAERFVASGAKVYTKKELARERSLLHDPHYRDLMEVVLSGLAEMDYFGGKIQELMSGNTNAEGDQVSKNVDALLVNASKVKEAIISRTAPMVKCDLDPEIVAESIDPATLEGFDTQVFMTGDGDFATLYKKLHNAGKRVIVVSPEFCLSNQIRKLAADSVLTVLAPGLKDEIWKRGPLIKG